jgi:oxygen-independent coproporphyrinogen-3 oxidase
LYQLTIEPGTAFGFRAQAGKLAGLPNEDLSADMFDVTNEICAKAGLYAYEVSNYSHKSLESKHNNIYWRGGDYVGIGPGAHGRLTLGGKRHATRTALAPQAWLERVELQKSGTSHQETLTPQDHANELIMMGLRILDGISRTRIESVANAPLDIPSHLLDMRLLDLRENQLRATKSGRPLLNQLVQALMY